MEVGKQIVKRDLGIDQEATLGSRYYLVVGDIGLRDIADNGLQDIVERDESQQASVFVYDEAAMDLGLLELLQHHIRCVVLRYEERQGHDVLEGDIVVGDIEVLYRDHPLDIVDLAIADGIDGMRLADDLFLDGLFVLIQVEPDDIAAVGHQGGDIAVAEVEHPLDDLLFGFLDGTLFGAFVDEGLYLVLRDGAVFGWPDLKELEEEVAGIVEQPHDGVGDDREDPDRSCHKPGDLLGPQQADAFGDQFAEDDG